MQSAVDLVKLYRTKMWWMCTEYITRSPGLIASFSTEIYTYNWCITPPPETLALKQ